MQNRVGFTKDKLKRELHEMLIEHDISLDTSIINELLYEMANIKLNHENDYHVGLNLNDGDVSQLTFSIPKLNVEQLSRLLTFFDVDSHEIKIGEPINLGVNHFYLSFLGKLENCFNAHVAKNSELIRKYQIQSKGILEAVAIESMRKYIQESIHIILPKITSKCDSQFFSLMLDELNAMKAGIDGLRHYPVMYKNILTIADTIRDFIGISYIAEKPGLSEKFEMLLESAELFRKYNRTESVLSNQYFLKGMNDFLKPYKIDSKSCDVIEDGLLNLADIKLDGDASCDMSIGQDRSRMVFRIHGIDAENTDKLVKYLRDQGDETAVEGFGRKSPGHVIPQAAGESRRFDEICAFSTGIRQAGGEEHAIEMDGKFLHAIMLPLFTSNIQARLEQDEHLLANYQTQSADYFVRKEIKAANKSAFFQSNVGGSGVASAENSLRMDLRS